MMHAFIVGHDSELGRCIGNHLLKNGWTVVGTTRRKEEVTATKLYLDANDLKSIDDAVCRFLTTTVEWDLLVIAIGILNPVGKITDVDFESWRKSVDVNFVNQLYVIKKLIEESPAQSVKPRKVLTFAGGGTNSATTNFSAYTLSKIALIKATELLAAEYPEVTFLSLGTGWMKSPIHFQTVEAGDLAGSAYAETKRRLESNEFGEPGLLLDFIDWYLDCGDFKISGRNIALQGDDWKSPNFLKELTLNDDAFKLRRAK